ncbi:MAG TPA: HAMP domain-containing sensor histidine kinase [Candidatus Saccharimonadales bacterium]|nr:HAMP domain-containing sensor histidine kinase [Candidatus Saccharimonadales bacterium]
MKRPLPWIIRRILWAAGCLVAVVAIGVLDIVVPAEYSFEAFYVVIVVLAALRGRRATGVAIGVAAAIVWVADSWTENALTVPSALWDLGTRAFVFVGLAVLIDLYQKRGTRLATIDRHREDSLSLVAHKLRQTAERIGAVTGAIGARQTDGVVTEARIALDRQARELRRMAEDVLDVNRLEASRLQLSLDQVDLADLVTEVARDLGRGQVQLVLQSEPVIVEADPDRLRVMVEHLIRNALQYSPAGASVLVTVSGNAGEARVVVKDQGVGLAAGDLTVLFQKYGQSHSVKAQGLQGVGLGLYVTRLIAEAHGGNVSADSTGPGLGATFQIALPLRQPSGARRAGA